MSEFSADASARVSEGGGRRRFTAVVASANARQTVARCLAALERQCQKGVDQIILVDSSRDGTADFVRQHFPNVEVVELSEPKLIPQLWGEGALRATGDVVGLLTAQVVPLDSWVQAHLQAHALGDWSAVGGPISRSADLTVVDSAVYWLRFARWAVPSYRGVVDDVAGDNASYRRDTIAAQRDRIQRDGFWENELHQIFRANGGRLFAAPDATVSFVGKNTFGGVARQRWEHGQRFGAQRVASAGGAMRVARVVTWPLTPFVFLARLLARARECGGTTNFARSLPVLGCFVAAWSLGELRGYLSGEQEATVAANPLKARM